ncbi:MAG: AbrB/MazE/SpoVT family DNA-binding domain-containing protein [Thermomicrobiales bacterium]
MAEIMTRVTSKGQTTIPVEVRRELGISAGGRVAWAREGDHVVLRPAESVVQRTAGLARRYRQGPDPTIREMKEAAAQGWVDEYFTKNKD